jgi:hypothetical protein
MLKEFYSLKEQNQKSKKYIKNMAKQEAILQEYEQFIQRFPELPTKEFWVNPEQ